MTLRLALVTQLTKINYFFPIARGAFGSTGLNANTKGGIKWTTFRIRFDEEPTLETSVLGNLFTAVIKLPSTLLIK